MVDVGCNLGDATIAAWLANAALRVLCLEPMPITYLYLRWNLLANGVPSLTPEMFAAASTKGGVLALPAGASADGRSLSIEYAPDLSGYGITSVSTDTGSIVADSGLAGTRNHAKHRVSADEFLRASGVPSLNLTAWLDAHGVSAVRFLKMVRHSGLARAHCSRCPALGGASVRYAPRVSVHMPARPLRSSRTMATSRPSPRPYPIPLVLASPSFHRPTLATPTYPGLRGL
jgi:FkbM family methyltransferase